MHQSNVLYSNPKDGLKFILNCIFLIIGLIRVNLQNGPVMSQWKSTELLKLVLKKSLIL